MNTHPTRVLTAAALLAACATAAHAAPTINVGSVTLTPNTAGQVVSLYVTGDVGGNKVQGLNFDVSTGGGGVQFGGTLAPAITSVNLKPAGGLFAGIGDGQQNAGSSTQANFSTLAYLSGGSGATITIPAARTLLAQVTVSTVGFATGTYAFSLANVLPNGGGTYGTDFAGVPAAITNGTLTIGTVPEPASLATAAVAGAVLARRRRTPRP